MAAAVLLCSPGVEEKFGADIFHLISAEEVGDADRIFGHSCHHNLSL
jgi:hypothetical protein